ncbi:unnamed protein product [Ceutorhynchus assimilis]|uniref:Nuclear speckle splicing regulatory protein 1 N-terminal domain-containing protein n=1 Tax=Ceutorhynchus assimilis TaxID=467358 RepID=A0A9N9MUB2_9CUCU|nr:unnamed protein product [Ceutorhynchus assimilis]
MAKQYGLIKPNKKATGPIPISRPSIFDEDSDSDSPKSFKPTGSTKVKKQDIINQQKALEEDPTVYQYDEVYDAMETKKKESKLARKDIDKKPKYISKLLQAAERRKREHERRVERQVQKEREEEGEEFKDKESFVTSAYKKKLEEFKVLEEQEKREAYLEAIGDVTKQGNLDGFYRHLYDQKVNFDDKKKENDIKKEVSSDNEETKKDDIKEEDTSEATTSKKRKSSSCEDTKTGKTAGGKRRKYRSRKDINSDDEKSVSESEKTETQKAHLPSNLDADSDFSVDDSSDDEETVDKKDETEKDKTVENEGEKLQLPAKGNVLSDNAALAKKGDDEEKDEKNNDNEKPKKPKIDIWKKRTVGEIFDEAVKRYFERKSARGW